MNYQPPSKRKKETVDIYFVIYTTIDYECIIFFCSHWKKELNQTKLASPTGLNKCQQSASSLALYLKYYF